MGPPVRQLWDHRDDRVVVVPLPGYFAARLVGGSRKAAMAFREIGVQRDPEVCRCGSGVTTCGRSSGCPGWIVKWYGGM